MEARMKKAVLIACISLLAAGCMNGPPTEPSASEQAQLGAALAGYEPSGPALSCVSSRELRGNRSFGEGAIVFDGPTRSTLYVNRPSGGCPELGFGRALVTHQQGPQLCRGDIADVFETSTRTTYGSCVMGDFTPYRRVKR
jgi:hypothetical protein